MSAYIYSRPPKYDSKGHLIKHLEFSRIDKYIYIGTSICCRFHFQKLLDMLIKADIDMQEEKEDKPSGVESFLWLPTTDFTPPSQKQLIIGSHFIEDLVNNKMKCYVHCQAGLGRAPTIVAAYYILTGKMVSESLKRIKKYRPLINPNRSQVLALNKFYKSVN